MVASPVICGAVRWMTMKLPGLAAQAASYSVLIADKVVAGVLTSVRTLLLMIVLLCWLNAVGG